MNLKNIRKNPTQQKGFAMLEVLLAVLIIAIASFGIYKLYTSSSTSSEVSSATSVVSQVGSAASKYAAMNGIQPTTALIANSGFISDPQIIDGVNGFKSIFGELTIIANPNDSSIDAFGIQVPSVPKRAAMDLAQSLSATGDVWIGAAGAGTYYDPAAADNSAILNGLTDVNNITVYFPKGSKVN